MKGKTLGSTCQISLPPPNSSDFFFNYPHAMNSVRQNAIFSNDFGFVQSKTRMHASTPRGRILFFIGTLWKLGGVSQSQIEVIFSSRWRMAVVISRVFVGKW